MWMTRCLQAVTAFAMLAGAGLPATTEGSPGRADGVFYLGQSFHSGLPPFIHYPPFDPTMADIRLHGDPEYHYPELEIDLTAEMVNLEKVRFDMHGTMIAHLTATPRAEAPEQTYDYQFRLEMEWEAPRPDHGFALGTTSFIHNGMGPGTDVMTRPFGIRFELNEQTDAGGVAFADVHGFDIPSFMIEARRSNFILQPDFGSIPHYFYPVYDYHGDIHSPPDAAVVVLPLPIEWIGMLHIEYHFSLNYEAIDHAILFEQFRDPILDWDITGPGIAELESYGDHYAARLTTGSSVSMSRLIETPDQPLLLMFNYAFLTETGTLEVSVDEETVLSLEAEEAEPETMQQPRILIADRGLLGRADSRLAFTLRGPTGSQALLDNIGVYAVSGSIPEDEDEDERPPEPPTSAPRPLCGAGAGILALTLSLTAVPLLLRGRRRGRLKAKIVRAERDFYEVKSRRSMDILSGNNP